MTDNFLPTVNAAIQKVRGENITDKRQRLDRLQEVYGGGLFASSASDMKEGLVDNFLSFFNLNDSKEETMASAIEEGLGPEFVKEAMKIEREGIKSLLAYLENETDFFLAPASTKYHGAVEGGLVEHSLAVHDVAHEMNRIFELELDSTSISICSLFHDVCKANFYTKEKRNKKINGKWEEVEEWAVKDQFPMGHGEKSVFLLQRHIKLTDEEAMAIRWHLGAFEPGIHFGYPTGMAMKQAANENKLVSLIITADFSSSFLLGK